MHFNITLSLTNTSLKAPLRLGIPAKILHAFFFAFPIPHLSHPRVYQFLQTSSRCVVPILTRAYPRINTGTSQSYYYFTRTYGRVAGSAAVATTAVPRESGSTRLSTVYCSRVRKVSFLLPIYKGGARNIFLLLAVACHT